MVSCGRTPSQQPRFDTTELRNIQVVSRLSMYHAGAGWCTQRGRGHAKRTKGDGRSGETENNEPVPGLHHNLEPVLPRTSKSSFPRIQPTSSTLKKPLFFCSPPSSLFVCPRGFARARGCRRGAALQSTSFQLNYWQTTPPPELMEYSSLGRSKIGRSGGGWRCAFGVAKPPRKKPMYGHAPLCRHITRFSCNLSFSFFLSFLSICNSNHQATYLPPEAPHHTYIQETCVQPIRINAPRATASSSIFSPLGSPT
ncbi:hypothetical protein F4859DRAFT_491041 [Xylaria cf. heliscus]|nr:hypothetical protein F4859DRAFT_491041 [Xylaria cf. heliscus]